MSTSNEQWVTLAADTEAHLGWDEWFDEVIVENLGSMAVWVATDGTAAVVDGEGLDVVAPNSFGVFANRQPRLAEVTAAAGSTVQALIDPPSGAQTYVSLISSGTPQVVVSPQ